MKTCRSILDRLLRVSTRNACPGRHRHIRFQYANVPYSTAATLLISSDICAIGSQRRPNSSKRPGTIVTASRCLQARKGRLRALPLLTVLARTHHYKNVHTSTGTTFDETEPVEGPKARSRVYKSDYAEEIAQHLGFNLDSSGTVAEDSPWESIENGQDKDTDPWHDGTAALAILEKHTDIGGDVAPTNITGLARRVYQSNPKRGLGPIKKPPKYPQIWTEESLTAYIQDLVNHKTPRGSLLKVLPEAAKQKHLLNKYDVADTIETVLHNAYLRKYQNANAFNIALQYLYDNLMLDRARSLYLRMEYLCLDIRTKTWNVMLRAATRGRDICSFTFLLDRMIKRGFTPNSMTWALFLRLLESEEAKQSVVRIMRSRGMLADFSVQRMVAEQMVSKELDEYLKLGSIGQPFLDHMRHRYGPVWMSTSSGNRIIAKPLKLKSSLSRDAVKQALTILDDLKQEAFAPDHVTMEIFIQACKRIDDLNLCLEALSTLKGCWGLNPDNRAHESLFQHAWRNKLLNVLRVIWVSACLNGYVTRTMETSIRRSIRVSETVATEAQPLASFETLAVWYATSVNPTRFGDSIASQGLLALESSLATAGQGHMKGGVIPWLRQAVDVDLKWSSQGFWEDPEVQATLLPTAVPLHIKHHATMKGKGSSNHERLSDDQLQRGDQ